MERAELEKRCLAVLYGNEGMAFTVQERTKLLADLLTMLTADKPCCGDAPKTKTRGQEVAEKLIGVTPMSLSGKAWSSFMISDGGSLAVDCEYHNPKCADDAAGAARKIVARVIDAERADAAKAEREACAKEPGNAMRDRWDSCVAPPVEVRTLVTQIERNIRARQ